ncbi:MAG TPA: hypothetical protein VJO99_12045 [Burkholderiaceae bacterium]|nr:hypothetical protein [Burkholderiaceae bacterium]
MRHPSKLIALLGPVLAALGAAVLLVACGGGGGDDGGNGGGGGGSNNPPPVTSEVPASASASVNGFVGYLKALVVAAADLLEPVDVATVTPPSSDTAEPAQVD